MTSASAPGSPASDTSSVTLPAVSPAQMPSHKQKRERETTVIAAIRRLDEEMTQLTPLRDSTYKKMKENANACSRIGFEIDDLKAHLKLLAQGQYIIRSQDQPDGHKQEDTPNEITLILDRLKMELAEKLESKTRYRTLLNLHHAELLEHNKELRARRRKVDVLITVQDVIDKHNGTKGKEEAVITKIRGARAMFWAMMDIHDSGWTFEDALFQETMEKQKV